MFLNTLVETAVVAPTPRQFLQEVKWIDLYVIMATIAADGSGLVEGGVECFAEAFPTMRAEDYLQAVFVL